MTFPFGSLFNPFLDGVDLRGLEWLLKFFRRHAFLGITVTYPEEQFTRLRFPRRHQDGLPFTEQTFLEVQSLLGLALFFIGAVAGEAMVGQNGEHVAVELHLASVGADRQGEQQGDGLERLHFQQSAS